MWCLSSSPAWKWSYSIHSHTHTLPSASPAAADSPYDSHVPITPFVLLLADSLVFVVLAWKSSAFTHTNRENNMFHPVGNACDPSMLCCCRELPVRYSCSCCAILEILESGFRMWSPDPLQHLHYLFSHTWRTDPFRMIHKLEVCCQVLRQFDM